MISCEKGLDVGREMAVRGRELWMARKPRGKDVNERMAKS